MTPFVFLLDLDGTIVGDVSSLVGEWILLQERDKKKMKIFKSFLIRQLHKGILRPHFSDFCAMVRKHLRNVEFFVYTASGTTWANFLIPCIEETCGIQFQRPFFTRKHCIYKDGDFKKTIHGILPEIFKKLKRKYPDLKNITQLEERTCLIDNNDVLGKDERNKLIKCPTYEYTDYYDIFSRFNIDLIDRDSDCAMLAKNLVQYGLFPEYYSKQVIPHDLFRYHYYLRLCNNIKTSIVHEQRNTNASPKTDHFWIVIANIITNDSIELLDKKTIRNIQNKIHNECSQKENKHERQREKEKN